MPASVGENTAGRVIGWRELPRRERLRAGGFVGWIVVITLAFIQPLVKLVQYADQSSLNSYIPLVPFVSAYLLYIQRRALPSIFQTSIAGFTILSTVCALALFGAIQWGATLSVNDYLSLITLSFVSAVAAGGFLFLGSPWMSAAAFPMAFLIFMVPLPDTAVYWIERASVLASADVSAVFFRMTGTPLLRDGTVFSLPGIVLEIAQECSGIHSSWVLFITSLVASQLFLKSPWRRLVLVAFVFPLAIVRNSIRIVTIGLLCVHIGPHMIDSIVHRQGGPLFFALSLGPLFLLLAFLKRQER